VSPLLPTGPGSYPCSGSSCPSAAVARGAALERRAEITAARHPKTRPDHRRDVLTRDVPRHLVACSWSSLVMAPVLIPLGRTNLMVSRLGLGASYLAPKAGYLEAIDRGVRYFYWGSRRRAAMRDALRERIPRQRDDLVIVVQSYARVGFVVKRSVESALRQLGIDRADVLLLGWFNSPPAPRVIDAAMDLVEQGKVGHVGLSGHERTMFPTLIDDQRYGLWHVRYNAVHRGAEREVFPSLAERGIEDRPGLVTYTTTRWGHLCDPRRTPAGERTPCGTDCYRFAMSRPEIDVVIAGPGDMDQMRQALDALDEGPMDEEDLAWMRRVGDHIYGRDVTSSVRDGV
jgi:aryl-alcohol dehydrogenase-like predicted oxidoreductase